VLNHLYVTNPFDARLPAMVQSERTTLPLHEVGDRLLEARQSAFGSCLYHATKVLGLPLIQTDDVGGMANCRHALGDLPQTWHICIVPPWHLDCLAVSIGADEDQDELKDIPQAPRPEVCMVPHRLCVQTVCIASSGTDAIVSQRQEQRRSPRHDRAWLVNFSGEDTLGRGVTRNVSREGCCIKTQKTVNCGDYLSLRLSPTLTIELGIVRWISGEEFGVEFLSISPHSRDQLGSLLHI